MWKKLKKFLITDIPKENIPKWIVVICILIAAKAFLWDLIATANLMESDAENRELEKRNDLLFEILEKYQEGVI